MNTHDPRDDASLPDEDALKALYGNLPRKEPSPALDQAVRRMAAAALREPGRHRVPRWPLSVASAAVLVVAAGLGWRLYQQPSTVPSLPSPSAVTVPPATATAPALPAPPPMLSADEARSPEAYAPTPQAEQAQAPAHAAKRSAKVATQLAEQGKPTSLVTPSSVPAAPPAPPAPVAMSAAPAPEAAPAASHAMRAMGAPAAMTFARAAPPTGDPTAFNATDTPAQELEKIRQLFTQQRRDEALHRLAAFRQAHPDVAIPDDLSAQVPDHE